MFDVKVNPDEDEKPRLPGGSLLPFSPLQNQARKAGDLEALVHLNWLWNDARGDPIKLFKELEEAGSSCDEEATNGLLETGSKKLNGIERLAFEYASIFLVQHFRKNTFIFGTNLRDMKTGPLCGANARQKIGLEISGLK